MSIEKSGSSQDASKNAYLELVGELDVMQRKLTEIVESSGLSDEYKSELGHKIAQTVLDFMQAHGPQS